MRSFDLVIGDKVIKDSPKVDIKSPYDGSVVGQVVFACAKEMELAIQTACDAFPVISRMPAHERSTILRRMSQIIAGRREQLAGTVRDEAGKPITAALREVDRSATTFGFAAV